MSPTRDPDLRRLATLLLAGFTASPTAAGAQPNPARPQYEVFAVRYGTLRQYPLRSLVLGADSAARVDAAMIVWVLRGQGRVVLVDAGFYRDEFLESWAVEGFVRPDRALADGPLGIAPGDVTDIVITHLHWDHADGADLFPTARVWVQRAEYEHYRDPGHLARSGVFPSDMAMLKRIGDAGRLRLVPGDSQAIAPGILVYTGGRHTHESQYVAVETASGTAIIASDNLYLYENLERRRPIAATWDTLSNLAAQDRMRGLASSPRLVVPGHDVAVFERFPAVGPGVARIR
jgi:glyoxylase-like metal-dependent hydrolase (beta-lactamase superfamily II)